MIYFEANLIPITLAAASPLVYGFFCVRVSRSKIQRTLFMAFVSGFFCSYFAFIAEHLLNAGIAQLAAGNLLFGFIALIAVPEEAAKLASFLGLTEKAKSNHERLLIACFIGCGFAASENIVYWQLFGQAAIEQRFFTATAFHTFNAIVMARVALSKLIPIESVRILMAFAVAVLLHAAYDYFLASPLGGDGRYTFILALSVAAGYTSLRAYPADKVELTEA